MESGDTIAGPPKDPHRGTGRTRRMVMSLPETGPYVVVVQNAVVRRYVENMIVSVRSEAVWRAGRVVVVARESDVDLVRGLDAPFFVDHSWFDGRQIRWLFPYVRTWGKVL